MATEYTNPLPRPLSPELTRPFWEAAKRHELRMPRCTTCDHVFFYPRSECPRCLSTNLEWVKVSGRARLHSFNVVQQPALDEGPRLVSNIVQGDIDALRVDMPLEAVFDDVTPEWTLVKFKPA